MAQFVSPTFFKFLIELEQVFGEIAAINSLVPSPRLIFGPHNTKFPEIVLCKQLPPKKFCSINKLMLFLKSICSTSYYQRLYLLKTKTSPTEHELRLLKDLSQMWSKFSRKKSLQLVFETKTGLGIKSTIQGCNTNIFIYMCLTLISILASCDKTHYIFGLFIAHGIHHIIEHTGVTLGKSTNTVLIGMLTINLFNYKFYLCCNRCNGHTKTS